jgi:hypothetical protein
LFCFVVDVDDDAVAAAADDDDDGDDDVFCTGFSYSHNSELVMLTYKNSVHVGTM